MQWARWMRVRPSDEMELGYPARILPWIGGGESQRTEDFDEDQNLAVWQRIGKPGSFICWKPHAGRSYITEGAWMKTDASKLGYVFEDRVADLDSASVAKEIREYLRVIHMGPRTAYDATSILSKAACALEMAAFTKNELETYRWDRDSMLASIKSFMFTLPEGFPDSDERRALEELLC